MRIRKTLRSISRQRVAMVLPGNVWVTELSPDKTDAFNADAATCLLRGWIEADGDPVPTGSVQKVLDGHPATFDRQEPIFKVTDAGWSVINRDYTIAILGIVISAASVFLAVV